MTSVNSQAGLEAWDVTTNLTITSDFTITLPFNSDATKMLTSTVNINGEGFTITIAGASTFKGLFEIPDAAGTTITISNLDISYSGATVLATNAGTIIGDSNSSGTAYSLTITKCSVIGSSYTIGQAGGGLVGAYVKCTITNCYMINSGATPFSDDQGGCICGAYSPASTIISNCFSNSIINRDGAGGIVGYSFFGTVHDCYSLGAITGNGAGGIAGRLFSNGGFIINCYSTGNISSGPLIGGIAGFEFQGVINNCYSTGTISGSNAAIVGTVHATVGARIIKNCFGLYATGTGSGASKIYYSGTPTEESNTSSGSGTWPTAVTALTTLPNSLTSSSTYTNSVAYSSIWCDTNFATPPIINAVPFMLSVFASNPWSHTSYTSAAAYSVVIHCFLKGTFILTPEGEKLIETLKVGDIIKVSDGRCVPILFISTSTSKGEDGTYPVLIPTNYFGESIPNKDTYITSDHSIKVNGNWYLPIHFSDLKIEELHTVEYYNLFLPDYHNDFFLANGLIADALHTAEQLSRPKN